MSTSPYSEDLRMKVINLLKQGKTQREVADLLNIHINTVNNWWRRHKKEGTIAARVRPGVKRKLDLQELEAFMTSHGNCNLEMIATNFHVTKACVCICLKKIGYSYKKNVYLPGSKRRAA